MSQKNEILPLLLTVIVTSALLGGIAWWLLNKTFPNLNDRSNSSSSNSQISETLGAVKNVPKGLFNYGGSTTWAPIRKEVDFIIQQVWPKFRLVYTDPTAGTPGTGSGIRMLIENQLAFSQASRSLKDEEIQRAQQRGLTLKEVPVAIDGIAIAVHPDLPVSGLTITSSLT
jgi:phosphate transport system substrate-binding protein